MPATARIFYYIQQLEQVVRSRIDDRLKPEGITAGQFMTLSLIVHQGPLSGAELARRAEITAQSMGEFVKVLVAKRLIERVSDPAKQRAFLIRPTDGGRDTLARCESSVEEAERELFGCLSPEEVAHLRFQIGRVRQAAKATASVDQQTSPMRPGSPDSGAS